MTDRDLRELDRARQAEPLDTHGAQAHYLAALDRVRPPLLPARLPRPCLPDVEHGPTPCAPVFFDPSGEERCACGCSAYGDACDRAAMSAYAASREAYLTDQMLSAHPPPVIPLHETMATRLSPVVTGLADAVAEAGLPLTSALLRALGAALHVPRHLLEA